MKKLNRNVIGVTLQILLTVSALWALYVLNLRNGLSNSFLFVGIVAILFVGIILIKKYIINEK